ncbi:MAG: hypothetical protein QNJ44_18795 [Rhodobacter sp.]|nr:hypothetical protein [Rhodobacter sp.]
MTDIAGSSDRGKRGPLHWLSLLALAANAVALVTVAYWLFRARAVFLAANPDWGPVTVSRAISDPTVGPHFAFWVTLSGALLAFGVFFNAGFYAWTARRLPAPRRALLAIWLATPPAIIALQAVSGVGMHYLSAFRFPDHHAEHMAGSYMFFVAQALVVMGGTVLSQAILRDPGSLRWLEDLGVIQERLVRLRRNFGIFCISLTVFYVFLFKAKNVDLNPLNEEIYIAYTNVELALILCFLIFLGLFQSDLLALRRAQRRS